MTLLLPTAFGAGPLVPTLQGPLVRVTQRGSGFYWREGELKSPGPSGSKTWGRRPKRVRCHTAESWGWHPGAPRGGRGGLVWLPLASSLGISREVRARLNSCGRAGLDSPGPCGQKEIALRRHEGF